MERFTADNNMHMKTVFLSWIFPIMSVITALRVSSTVLQPNSDSKYLLNCLQLTNKSVKKLSDVQMLMKPS